MYMFFSLLGIFDPHRTNSSCGMLPQKQKESRSRISLFESLTAFASFMLYESVDVETTHRSKETQNENMKFYIDIKYGYKIGVSCTDESARTETDSSADWLGKLVWGGGMRSNIKNRKNLDRRTNLERLR